MLHQSAVETKFKLSRFYLVKLQRTKALMLKTVTLDFLWPIFIHKLNVPFSWSHLALCLWDLLNLLWTKQMALWRILNWTILSSNRGDGHWPIDLLDTHTLTNSAMLAKILYWFTWIPLGLKVDQIDIPIHAKPLLPYETEKKKKRGGNHTIHTWCASVTQNVGR